MIIIITTAHNVPWFPLEPSFTTVYPWRPSTISESPAFSNLPPQVPSAEVYTYLLSCLLRVQNPWLLSTLLLGPADRTLRLKPFWYPDTGKACTVLCPSLLSITFSLALDHLFYVRFSLQGYAIVVYLSAWLSSFRFRTGVARFWYALPSGRAKLPVS